MRAIMVCVDYADLLKVTLPYNRHHFTDVCVVTAPQDYATQDFAKSLGCALHVTKTFYARGAAFNKWAALEEAWDVYGRHGWVAQMDADVLLPKDVTWCEATLSNNFGDKLPQLGWRYKDGYDAINCGQLLTPLRRMAPWPYHDAAGTFTVTTHTWVSELTGAKYPDEPDWKQWPIHRNVNEWAGYCQVFHCSDPHLGPPPWHEIDWAHAGGADSLFQRRWLKEHKLRPNWECLHLGEAGKNWFGRNNPDKVELTNQIWRGRALLRSKGATEAQTFEPEKLK